MRTLTVFIILLFSFKSYSYTIDTLFLFIYNQGTPFNGVLDIKIFSEENKIIKEIHENNYLKEIKIPIQKGKYNVFIDSQFNWPMILSNVETNKHYLPIELFNDPIIKDTIKISPIDYIITSTGYEGSSYIFQLTDKEVLINYQAIKWQNPFQLNWNYFEQNYLYFNQGCNSELSCDIFVEINKPSIFTWNYLKSCFSYKNFIKDGQKNLYINNKYFTVIAYVNPYLSKVCKASMTDNELYYNRVVFNIYELYARKLRQYLSVNNSIEIYRFRKYIIIHAKDACNNYITYFKQDTQFGKDEDKIKHWYQLVYNELKLYKKYAFDSYTSYFDERLTDCVKVSGIKN